MGTDTGVEVGSGIGVGVGVGIVDGGEGVGIGGGESGAVAGRCWQPIKLPITTLQIFISDMSIHFRYEHFSVVLYWGIVNNP